MKNLKEGQSVTSEFENATTGAGRGKTTGASYECDFDKCKDGRVGVIWNDDTIKYPCSREMVYDPANDSWTIKLYVPYCKYDIRSY